MDLNKIYKQDCHEGLKKLPDNSIDMVLCDPPYNTTDNEWDQQPLNWELIWTELKRIGKENTAYVFTASQPFTHDLIASNRKWHRYNLVWDKGRGSNFLLAKKMPMKSHEDIVVFYKKLPTYNPQWRTEGVNGSVVATGGHTPSDNWTPASGEVIADKTPRPGYYPLSIIQIPLCKNYSKNSDHSHPTQKPVELMEYLIKTYTNPDEVVLDFCIGSGTTGVAAIQTGRKYIGYETDDEYYDIAVERCNKVERKREQSEKFFEL